jgi:hypothetical protein
VLHVQHRGRDQRGVRAVSVLQVGGGTQERVEGGIVGADGIVVAVLCVLSVWVGRKLTRQEAANSVTADAEGPKSL